MAKHEFTGVFIPAHIWLSKEILPAEKMLLGEVEALSKRTGWCEAGRQHFAEWLNCDPTNVSHYISKLEKLGFLEVLRTPGYPSKMRVVSERFYVQVVVNGVHGGSEWGSRGVVNGVHGGSEWGSRGVVNGVHGGSEWGSPEIKDKDNLKTQMKENSAGASAPLSPPFKKVDEIEPLEAEKENPTPPVPARPPAPTIVKLYDNELPGVTVVDSIPPQPMTKPETTGRQRQARNTPHIHPENETCFSYFSDPAKARAAWQEWIDYKYEQHRERYKAAKSELSKLRQLFKQFSGDSEKFEVAVNYSIGNLYKGVFPPKQEKENGQFQHLDKAQQQHLKLARFVADLRNGSAFAGAGKVEYITGEKPV